MAFVHTRDAIKAGLSSSNFPLEAVDNNGMTPLTFAAATGDLELFTDLLKRDVNLLFKVDASNNSVLLTAVKHRKIEFLQHVLTLFNLNNPDQKDALQRLASMPDVAGRTPMTFAAGNGFTRELAILIDGGVNILQKDGLGDTALLAATKERHVLSVGTMINALSRKDPYHPQIFKQLIEIRDNQGMTAFDYAGQYNNKVIANEIEKGVKTNVTSHSILGQQQSSHSTHTPDVDQEKGFKFK